LWFNHGNRPRNASYQYIVVPDVSEQELMETGSNNRDIEIISNTSEIQAVKNNKLGICQIAFYKSGEVEISNGLKVRMDSQGMAMLTMRGNRIEKLTISDPSRKLSRILITVPDIYNITGDNFIVFPDSEQNNTLIVVDLPQGVFTGKSVVINF
ncbi:MAG: chondroitin lyase, partial [Cyclobacteriaceae bacterium]|nr:chondroitin lyase [Cyclobacteriaceae bacterium]